MEPPATQLFLRARWGLALVPLALTLAGCSSGGGGTGAGSKASTTASSTTAPTTPKQADAALESAGKTVQSGMAFYVAAVGSCAQKPSPVVCLETADRTLGGKIHEFANLLARHEPFTASQTDLTAALNSAQTLANSLEILGDAQPTQANYNQVLNTFNINSAITTLQGDVTTLTGSLGK